MSCQVFIVAAENSGDQLGAGLIQALRRKSPDITIEGVGGRAMAARQVGSDIDIAPLAILGFTEAIKAYPVVLDRVKQVTELILHRKPQCVVLIDSWGFMVRVARALKKNGYAGTIIKYVAPQVWAMREGRSKILAAAVDHLLTIHSFDAPYFEKHGLPVTYVGNPMFDTDYAQGDAEALRRDYQFDKDTPVLGIFFGSRLSEIQRLAGPIADTVQILKAKFPRMKFVSPLAEPVEIDVKALAGKDLRLQDIILLKEDRKFDVFAASNAALACSGTVTTQLACAGVPTVVTYRVSPVTWFIGKRLFKPDYVSLVNIAASAELMPECLQGDATGPKLSEAISPYFLDAAKRKTACAALVTQTEKMKGQGGSASDRAADAVLDILN